MSGSEVRMGVGFPTGWLSSDGGRSEEFRIFLRRGSWDIVHGEYWGFLSLTVLCVWGVGECSRHDLRKIQLKGLSSNILLGSCQ